MGKIGLIIRSEYKNRVTKKSFLILTFLMPLLFCAIIFAPMWLATFGSKTEQKIAIVDWSGLYENSFTNSENYTFEVVNEPIERIKTSDKNTHYQAIIVISGDLTQANNSVTIYSDQQIDYSLKQFVQNALENRVRHDKLLASGIPNIEMVVENAETSIPISTIKWNSDGSETISSSDVAMIAGVAAMMIIYMFIFVYAVMVMNSVVQEKINRIVEVMICSVKPIELMIGKIVSIALVGLTQFAIWAVLTTVISLIFNVLQEQTATFSSSEIYKAFLATNWLEIGFCFLLYFVGGYLLYASIFAAVGAVVDNETDTQQFTLPITLPLLFAIYAAIYGAQNPNGPLAFWCSLIPFTSPIVMMVRLPFGVPIWQLILSLILLITTFVSTSFMSAKIYRTSILMYGKRASWKTIWQLLKSREK